MKTTNTKPNNSELIKRFAPYFKKYYPSLAIDLFCAGLTTVGELVLPLIVKQITNTAINDISQLTVQLVLSLGGLYVFLRLIDSAAYYYMTSYGHIMGTKIENDMRADLFAHLQKLPFSYYDDMKIGQLMSRITNDLFQITEFAHHCPEEFFIAAVKITATFVILCRVNVPLTLILFTVLPLMLICTARSRRNMRLAFKRRKHELGEINSQAEDSLLGIRVVKSFANEDEENRKFADGNKRFFKAKAESYRHMGSFHTTTRVFEGLMYIVIVVIGALFMINGKITPADYTAYLLYVSTLLVSVKRIVEFSEQFEEGMTGIERFIEIMDAPTEKADGENATPLENVKGDVTFDNVTFKYTEEKGEVLSHISLDVKAGENVAIVGPSGSGKTTLCNLLPRFYELTGGRILIDGNDISSLTLSSLRASIGVVQQDVYLFSGTVRENIAYGKPNATDEEIISASKLAGAHDFISALPNGYDTYVGERGVMLSGGQKQRISIARVFIKNPPILILDEATSALDNESELLVQQSLSELAKGRTTFTIAHRLTTVKNASVIIVLTENGIEEKGTHSELIAQKGIYYELYKLYESRQ